jgi:hypothetical protein
MCPSNSFRKQQRLKQQSIKTVIVSKNIKWNQKICSKCLPSFAMPKKAELDAECLCFDEFPERRFELVNCKTTTGNLQHAEYFVRDWFSISWRISSATTMRSSREDAAQRLHRFVHWEVPFEESFHRRFALLALNVHVLRHRSRPYQFSSGESHLWFKLRLWLTFLSRWLNFN